MFSNALKRICAIMFFCCITAMAHAIGTGYYFLNNSAAASAFDSSGNEIHGTMSNVTLDAAGIEGEAIAFNGSTSQINIPHSSYSTFDSSYAISCWVKTASSADQVIAGKSKLSLGGYVLEMGSTGILYFGHSADIVQSKKSVNDNAWHHVAAVYDKSNSLLHLYIDGAKDSTATCSASPVPSDSVLTIGAGYSTQGAGPMAYYNGSIDNVHLYKGVLTAEEIGVLFKNIVFPVVMVADFHEGLTQDDNLDGDDYVSLIFEKPVYRFSVNAANINSFFPLFSSVYSWLSGSGAIGYALWSSDSTELSVMLSVNGGAPAIAPGYTSVKYYAYGSQVTVSSLPTALSGISTGNCRHPLVHAYSQNRQIFVKMDNDNNRQQFDIAFYDSQGRLANKMHVREGVNAWADAGAESRCLFYILSSNSREVFKGKVVVR